jgi:hypothetical protein
VGDRPGTQPGFGGLHIVADALSVRVREVLFVRTRRALPSLPARDRHATQKTMIIFISVHHRPTVPVVLVGCMDDNRTFRISIDGSLPWQKFARDHHNIPQSPFPNRNALSGQSLLKDDHLLLLNLLKGSCHRRGYFELASLINDGEITSLPAAEPFKRIFMGT